MATTVTVPATINSGNTPGGDWAEITIDEADIPAAWDIGWNHAAKTSNVTFNVTVPGYTSAGASTTKDIEVYGTKVIRQPHPNASSDQEVDNGSTVTVTIALSRPIYASDTINSVVFADDWYTGASGETISSGITNSSTRVYPKPISDSYVIPFKNLTGPIDIEVSAKHLFGIAAVVMVLEETDGTEIDTVTVTEPSISSNAAQGNGTVTPVISAFIGELDIGATTGNVRVQWEVFPNEGDVTFDSRAAADGVDAVEERQGPLRYVGNQTVNYYAVDGVGGSPASATDEATARLTPYASIAAAVTAGAGGGDVIVLESGTYTTSGLTIGNNDGYVALTVRNATGVTDAVFAGSTNDAYNGIMRVTGCDVISSETGAFVGTNAAGSAIIFEGVPDLRLTGTAAVYKWGAIFLENNNGSGGGVNIRDLAGFSSNRGPVALARGNHFVERVTDLDHTLYYTAIGNTGVVRFGNGNATNGSSPDNTTVEFNIVDTRTDSSQEGMVFGGVDVTHGLAIENNIVVSKSTTSASAIFVYADGDASDSAHVLVRNNTAIDERINIFYNDADGVSTPRIDCQVVGNLCDTSFNMKSDTFVDSGHGAQTIRTGNWAPRYSVSSYGDHRSTDLGGTFTRELENDVSTGAITYEADGYTPASFTAKVGPGATVYDVFGNRRKTTGFTSGAVEIDPFVASVAASARRPARIGRLMGIG